MHSGRQYAAPFSVGSLLVAFGAAALLLAGCGNTYRPVVSSINPVGPAGQPTKYAVAVSSPSPTLPGLSTLIDVSGDTIVNTTPIGVNPYYLQLDNSNGSAFTLNGDGTISGYQVTPQLISSNVSESTLLPGSNPVSVYAQGGNNYYVAQPGRGSVAQAQLGQGTALATKQELATGAGTVYVVGANGSPRAYALVAGSAAGAGSAAAIETTTNTVSANLPVGTNPTYGVMTADSRRAFILNKGSNTVTVINAQANALDTFTVSGAVTSTIPVGVGPVWADFAPTLSELVVANAGNGTTPGSVTIISIPLCSQTTVTSNPNCDPANPIDAVGFGQVVANIPVGINPVMVAVLQDGTQAYVANAGNAAASIAGSVSVINLTTNTVVATIAGAASTNANDNLIHGHPVYIAATTGTPTGKVYVVAKDSTDITILRTDTDAVQTHLSLQGQGISVRVNTP